MEGGVVDASGPGSRDAGRGEYAAVLDEGGDEACSDVKSTATRESRIRRCYFSSWCNNRKLIMISHWADHDRRDSRGLDNSDPLAPIQRSIQLFLLDPYFDCAAEIAECVCASWCAPGMLFGYLVLSLRPERLCYFLFCLIVHITPCSIDNSPALIWRQSCM